MKVILKPQSEAVKLRELRFGDTFIVDGDFVYMVTDERREDDHEQIIVVNLATGILRQYDEKTEVRRFPMKAVPDQEGRS